jgi:hypothetical protein
MSSSATRVPSAEEGAGWVHVTFPEAHRRQIRSTNPLERLNKELNDGDEDRLREDLRGSATTATGADALPRTVASSTASTTGNEASSFRSRPSRSRWPPPWSRSCGSSSRFTGARDQASRESDRLSVGASHPSAVEC